MAHVSSLPWCDFVFVIFASPVVPAAMGILELSVMNATIALTNT
jgi:hypothetical protein